MQASLADDALDVVIIQRTTPALAVNGSGGGCGRATCRRHHRDRAARKRHNATQTPDATMRWCQRALGGGLHECHHHASNTAMCCCNCCCNTGGSCCAVGFCQEHASSVVDGGIAADMMSHCHITHHCHHYSPSSGIAAGASSEMQPPKQDNPGKRRKRASHLHHHRYHHIPHHQHQHRHHHQHHHRSQHVRHLAASNTKSSFESSNEQLNTPYNRHGSPKLQEIAIEIDAATMTENNSSTGTSNFAYKMPGEHMTTILMAPTHADGRFKQRRRGSGNSNTTIETDGFSHEEEDAYASKEEDEMMRRIENGNGNGEESSTTTPQAIYCDVDKCCRNLPLDLGARGCGQNQCVNIKRKRFIPPLRDYCSSDSHCSSYSCHHQRTSSCSSLEEFDADDRPPHEFTVSAECHRCTFQGTSSTESASTADDDDDKAVNVEMALPPQPLVQEATTDSSARTSRRSSESFCSCNSSSCCYCSCSCEDCEKAQMRSAKGTPSGAANVGLPDVDDQHSSTLTPLTNPSSVVSTPLGDDADVTIRSMEQVLADDASSLSQSAEYFSLSSCNQQSQVTPTPTPAHSATKTNIAAIGSAATATAVANRKPCKHYSKHHRHKRTSPPIDSYL